MQKIILFLLLFSPPFHGVSQTIIPPVWNEAAVEFNTAKLKIYQDKTNKILWDGYKDSHIIIIDANTVSPEITIDIPDKFFLKSGITRSVTYKYDGEEETIAYNVVQDKKMAGVNITYNFLTDKLVSIVVVATDNYMQKPVKLVSFTLYEVK